MSGAGLQDPNKLTSLDGNFEDSWKIPSSGMWRRVGIVRTDVSEEHIGVKGISELRKTLAVTTEYQHDVR
jgi:hypothetical protein